MPPANPTNADASKVRAAATSTATRLAWMLCIPVLLWGELIYKLTTDWSTNAQYEFGYFVPFFIIYLLARRWSDRPEPSERAPGSLILLIGCAGLIALLPLRVIQEANPDWRPLNWVHASLVVILTLLPFAASGGSSWVRHFSVPLLLIFSTLPWSLAAEQGVLQALAGAVTAVTVELLNICNIPAIQRGNVIDLAAGSVGIADACSGIRSLAGTLMASLFFGEFYRLGAGRRLALVIGGCLTAFVLNLCRAFFLSWQAAASGVHSIEKWHDPAGFTIFLISFAALWMMANLLLRGEPELGPATASPSALPLVNYKCITFGMAWVLGVEVFCEGWYRNREQDKKPSLVWEVQWPEKDSSFKYEPISDETRSILRYTSGQSAILHWDDGSLWQAFYFRWAPGRSSAQLSTMHRPEVCLPAAGYRRVGEAHPLQITLPGIPLQFTGSIFDCEGTPVYVYRCLWEDHPISGQDGARNLDMSVKGRLMGAWYGRRNLGQRMFQVALVGARNEDEASEQLKRRLPGLIVEKNAS